MSATTVAAGDAAMKPEEAPLYDYVMRLAAAGLACDVAWHPSVAPLRVARDAIPRSGGWAGKFAERPAPTPLPAPPAVTKDPTMDADTYSKLTEFLSGILDADQMSKVTEIVGAPPDLASDAALRRRVAQGVAEKRAADAASFAKRFPNANRLSA